MVWGEAAMARSWPRAARRRGRRPRAARAELVGDVESLQPGGARPSAEGLAGFPPHRRAHPGGHASAGAA
eukprot:7966716-Lingulodinium_polyedra.AAC.1